MSSSDPIGLSTLETIAQASHFNRWMQQVVAAELCPGNVLEVGTGIGNLAMHFLADGWEMTLSELRPAYCERLRMQFASHSHVKGVVPLDLAASDFSQRYGAHLGQYANVYALNVIEHIEDDQLALRNAATLLRPGGRMVILVPAYPWLYNRFDAELGHFRRYTRERLRTSMEAAGMLVNKTFAFNLAGIMGWWVSGKLLHKEQIPSGQMRLYDRLVPIFRRLDQWTGQRWGLSVVAVGESSV